MAIANNIGIFDYKDLRMRNRGLKIMKSRLEYSICTKKVQFFVFAKKTCSSSCSPYTCAKYQNIFFLKTSKITFNGNVMHTKSINMECYYSLQENILCGTPKTNENDILN